MSSHPSERPTWTSAGSLRAVLLGLAPGGVCLAAASPRRRCALTAPFHPCLAAPRGRDRGRCLFCGTFPRVSPGRRYRPPRPVVSGLSSKAPRRLRGCSACVPTVPERWPGAGTALVRGSVPGTVAGDPDEKEQERCDWEWSAAG